ncbi:hypothetical protein C8R46DRAFT_1205828 [Mycena filopes]|nr:hypothetical protein C8R46DRAFT_1205828 [Mycena filopes]
MSAKRKRTENGVTRSEIWHIDGSLVIHAENTQFRVHWGLLAMHSSHFRDLQGRPQPRSQPTVEDCPLLELPDALVDVRYLLKALYTPTFLAQTSLPLPIIGALIRLGRRYKFLELFKSAVERLTFENPATFEEYHALISDSYTMTRIAHCPGVDFDILSLAQENNIQTILPFAFYRVVQSTELVCSSPQRLTIH